MGSKLRLYYMVWWSWGDLPVDRFHTFYSLPKGQLYAARTHITTEPKVCLTLFDTLGKV